MRTTTPTTFATGQEIKTHPTEEMEDINEPMMIEDGGDTDNNVIVVENESSEPAFDAPFKWNWELPLDEKDLWEEIPTEEILPLEMEFEDDEDTGLKKEPLSSLDLFSVSLGLGHRLLQRIYNVMPFPVYVTCVTCSLCLC